MRFAPSDQEFDVVSESYRIFYVIIVYLAVMAYNARRYIYQQDSKIHKGPLNMMANFPTRDYQRKQMGYEELVKEIACKRK